MKITEKQIRENILDKGKERCDFVISTTTEEDCKRITQELSQDKRKLTEFLRACFALGFMCHEAGEKNGMEGKKHFMAAMTGAAVLAETVRFSNEMKAKN